MKIIAHKRKSKNDTIYFTIKQISREDLSLLLTFADEKHPEVYKDLQGMIRKIECFVNGDDFVRDLTGRWPVLLFCNV